MAFRLVWATDLHLNFLNGNGPKAFGEYTARDYPNSDAIVITGDIGEYDSTLRLLTEFAGGYGKPVHWILGNHDVYRGSIASMQKKCEKFKAANWLGALGKKEVRLTETSCLVGQDGWYDAKIGNIYGLWMSDFELIQDYKSPTGMYTSGRSSPIELTMIARNIARREVTLAEEKLRAAVAAGYKRVYFATHVPPFEEATWHEGKQSSATFLPWFCSVSMGEMLHDIAYDYLDVEFVVLCGHTHGRGTYQHSPNMVVKTGFANYGHPQIEEEIEVP